MLRDVDLLARWGGDEFVAVLSDLGGDATSAASSNAAAIVEAVLAIG